MSFKLFLLFNVKKNYLQMETFIIKIKNYDVVKENQKSGFGYLHLNKLYFDFFYAIVFKVLILSN